MKNQIFIQSIRELKLEPFVNRFTKKYNPILIIGGKKESILHNNDRNSKVKYNTYKKIRYEKIDLLLAYKVYKYFKICAINQYNTVNVVHIIEKCLDEIYLDERIFSLSGVSLIDKDYNNLSIKYAIKRQKSRHYITVRLHLLYYTLLYFKYCAKIIEITPADLMVAYLDACAYYRADIYGRCNSSDYFSKSKNNLSMTVEKIIELNKTYVDNYKNIALS